MNIKPPSGAKRPKKVLGRGTGTGKGTTCGKGTKGQKCRSGYKRKIGFEGGQMPLARRIPKRGFNNSSFEKRYQIINLSDLNRYKSGQKVDYETLLKDRLVNRKGQWVKLLAKGELKKKLQVGMQAKVERMITVADPINRTILGMAFQNAAGISTSAIPVIPIARKGIRRRN